MRVADSAQANADGDGVGDACDVSPAAQQINCELERQIAERTAELAVANRHLESFAYSISHDLQAPVRAITSFGEILATDFGDRLGDDGRTHLDRVVGNARRMSELIDAMLALSRVTKTSLDVTVVDLGRVAREVAGELAALEPSRNVELVIHDDLHAKGDRTLLRAAITNLLSNAWKFTSRRASARVEVGAAGSAGDHRVFFVRDNGAGFDMRHAQALFGVFRRLHRDDEFPGTGVGLATVERIVTRHGGRIWVEARVGEGATFYFTLPETSG